MTSNGPSVIFGRPPVKTRASFNGSTNQSINISSHEKTNFNDPKSKLSNEDKLRLIQLEIAEKEACKVLRSICEENSKQFNVPIGVELEINDILTGILMLGNLCKRIGNEKLVAEKNLEDVKATISDTEKKHLDVIAQLEQVILNLQAENVKVNDLLGETNLKHSHKMNMLSKEMSSLHDTIESLKLENERFVTKLQYAERKLMDLPRLEETYMRNAKSMIRQQEITNTKNKVEMKKNQEEMKSLYFWKNKAKINEETVTKLTNEVNQLQVQNRQIQNKYNTLLQSSNKVKSRPNSAMASTSNNAGNAMMTTRPVSAPVTRRPSSAAPNTSTVEKEDSTELVTEINDSPARKSVHYTSFYDEPNLKSSKALGKSRFMEKVMEGMNAEEIMKLKNENLTKSQTIVKLSRKLSHARAYPLLSIEESENNDGDKAEQDVNISEFPINGSQEKKYHFINQYNFYNTEISDNKYMKDELESVSSNFLREEEALADKRIKNALNIQTEYNQRYEEKRNHASKHVKAIRSSKKFSDLIDYEENKRYYKNKANRVNLTDYYEDPQFADLNKNRYEDNFFDEI